MAATYNSVQIGSTVYEVYADIATIDQYMEAEASAYGAAWRAQLDPDAKARDAITATRLLDRQKWPGTKSDEFQELEFPRDNMDSDCAIDGVIPQRLIDAACVLAAMIEQGVDVTGSASIQSEIKRQKAGSVEIEYFRPVDAIARFPLPVQELLACLLTGGSSFGGVVTSGTDGCSTFDTDYKPTGAL